MIQRSNYREYYASIQHGFREPGCENTNCLAGKYERPRRSRRGRL